MPLSVLLVDDNPIFLRTLTGFLSKQDESELEVVRPSRVQLASTAALRPSRRRAAPGGKTAQLAAAGFTNVTNIGDGMVGRPDVGQGGLAANLPVRPYRPAPSN